MKKKALLFLSIILMVGIFANACSSEFSRTTLTFPAYPGLTYKMERTVTVEITKDKAGDTTYFIKKIEPPFARGLKYIRIYDGRNDGKLDRAVFVSEGGTAIIVKAWAGEFKNLEAEVLINWALVEAELTADEAKKFYSIAQTLLNQLHK